MEKLLEVLISIGDEIACLSVAELILRHWPSHSRALNVKNTIEESESIPFAPRGIDKLEPKHVRLKFLDKRKAIDDLDEGVLVKKLNNNLDIHLTEATWTALAVSLLEILLPSNGCDSKLVAEDLYRTKDIKVIIHLPQNSENVTGFVDGNSEKGNNCSVKEASVYEEHPQERRSSRLERLRSRKPDKEELDFSTIKDIGKVVIQSLEPFVLGGSGTKNFTCTEVAVDQLDNEFDGVARFAEKASKNYGAYHVAHLLLEEVSSRGILYHDAFTKFLELEKLTRHLGRDRIPECSLFLGELYYDFVCLSSDPSVTSDLISESSYHLCKVIESVALDCSTDSFESNCQLGSLLTNKSSFWARFFWLSGQLSIVDGDKAKAQKELSISLSLLTDKKNVNSNPLGSVCLPHSKVLKELTINKVLHEINMLEVDFLLKNTVTEMLEKEMYCDCVNLLAPLLFSTKDDHMGVSRIDREVEREALDVLIKAFEKSKSMDVEVNLNCHLRKLQILMVEAGMEVSPASQNSVPKMLGINSGTISEELNMESSNKQLYHLVAEEVKAISRCVSEMKSFINPCGNSNGFVVPMRIVGDIQAMLLAFMCNIANIHFSRRSSGVGVSDESDQRQRGYFVDSAITFFKLQHLNPNVPLKTQIEMIVAIHDMLAEYGLCCAGGDGEEEGTFLKLAIKHLLTLDMKLKSILNKGVEMAQCDEQRSQDDHAERSPSVTNMDTPSVEVGPHAGINKTSNLEKETVQWMTSNGIQSHRGLEKEKTDVECGDHADCGPDKASDKYTECGHELTEDEREELELGIDNALDQCFFCLYGLHLRSDSSYEDDLAMHKNTSRGDYQTKEQCADVFQYILPYAKASSRTGLVKLRRVLRAIRKHFPQPPENLLAQNAIEKFLDDADLCEDKLSEEAGSDGFLDSIMQVIFPDGGSVKRLTTSSAGSSEPYLEVYSNLYYLLAQSEEISASDKWPGFVLTKEGEEFVEQNANLFKYDLLYNPLRFESWQRLANIYDEEVDLLLNDGSKQVNVAAWRKSTTLSQRIETSRRRSRRCLLMTLALAKTAVQQGEIHELLALVYYDAIQNVVPIYDQRLVTPSKDTSWTMFCQNSMRHFKKAFAHKEDWSHVFYLGKLCEKLGYSHDMSFSFYDKAISLNQSAVDPFYRMHASRLKLLCTCGKQNQEALKVVAAYSFTQSTKDTVMTIFGNTDLETSDPKRQVESQQLEEVWNMLYSDSLSALEICVEGDLKHFHKARYMLAQGLYKRGGKGDLEKARDELSFCFKSSRSSFTYNMWEIDGMVKKGRRKTVGVSGNRKALEVNLPESSRKFITCIRKYMLFYLKLLDEARDISTLERAYISIRADKRFSLSVEDLVPIALGRYIKALISLIRQTEIDCGAEGSQIENLLEKMFSLFMEQVNLWSDICSLPEIKCTELSETSLYGYLYQYIQILERYVRLEILEGINEKIRKRLKNPKLSSSNIAKVYKHVSVAWCRSLVISMVLITPLHSRISSGTHSPNLSDSSSESTQLLCVDLQTDELWTSSLDDPNHLRNLERQWNPLVSKIKNVIIKKAKDEDLETATTLIRSSYNFYKDTSCAMLPSGINLYTVPPQLATETYIQPGIDGVDILDMSTSRKLILWAYTLLHGHCANISFVIKYCEENAKSKMKKGIGSSSVALSASTATAAHSGGGRDGANKFGEPETALSTTVASYLPGTENLHNDASAPLPEIRAAGNEAVSSFSLTERACDVASAGLAKARNLRGSNMSSSQLIHCKNSESSNEVAKPAAADPGNGCNDDIVMDGVERGNS